MLIKNQAKAKLMDATKGPYLLASFEESCPPTLWYYDLKRMKNAIICLKETTGEWDLGFTNTDGEFTFVAHFEERDAAENAYASVKKALMKEAFFPHRGPWLRLILVLAIILGGLCLWPTSASKKSTKTTHQLTSEKEIPKEIIPGVPMNADEILIPPED